MKFLCDSCKAKYQIADEKVAGKTVRMKCRKCGHQIEVRAAVTETSVASTPPRAPSEAPPPYRSSLATSLSAAKPKGPSAPHGGALAGAFQRQVQEAPSSMPPPAAGVAPGAGVELSVTDEWYVAINGVPVGPVRISELRRKAGAGAVTEDSLCWQEGLEEWRPIRTVPELATLVRDAVQGNRGSMPEAPRFTPVTPRPPAKFGVPSPPARTEAMRLSEPPRPPAPPRSNVVPFHARGASAPAPEESAASLASLTAAATARATAPSYAPPAPQVVPSRAADPFAFGAPSPAPTVDPFAVPTPAPVPAQLLAPMPVPAPPTTPSIPPGYYPEQQRRGIPLWFWPILVLALGFGVAVAVIVFKQQPPPAPVVIQMAPTAPAPATPDTSNMPLPPPSAEASANAHDPPKKTGAVAARPAPTGNERKTADISGLLGGAGGPAVGGGGPSGGAGGSFDQAAVERVVANHRAGVKRTCWERLSGGEQKSSVNVTVNATVAPNGSVSSTTSSGDDPVVGKCIENQVRTWQFPAPGEAKQIALPFKFVRQ